MVHRYGAGSTFRMLAALLATVGWVAAAGAQTPAGGEPRALSLEEALRIAERNSEQVDIAAAGVIRARGQEWQARSARLPQLNAVLSYDRALASEFEGVFGGGGAADTTAGPPRPQCQNFSSDPTLPVEERLRRVEAQLECVPPSPFSAFRDLPFGRENTVRFGLSLSQPVFTGGRLAAQSRIADASREVAQTELRSAQAQLILDVTQAYYDAVLAHQLADITEASLQQAETTLQQTLLARRVGTQPEFELLRAQVTVDNQRAVMIQRSAARDLAFLRLKQLLELPLDLPITPTDDLTGDEVPPSPRFAARIAALQADSATLLARAPVRQAAAAVDIREQSLRITRAQRLPALILNSQYGKVAYPVTGLPEWDEFRTNWTVGAAVSVPIFTGGRIHGEELVARADLAEAEARLRLARELALLDTRSAQDQLAAAQAAWEASRGTANQAARAYQIAEIRYREGISTQLELSDSRIMLQQALANRAQAARDLQLARARLALLPDLPLGAGSGAWGPMPSAPVQSPSQSLQQQGTPRQSAGPASQSAFTGAR